MTWDTEGQQESLLRFLEALPAAVKDNPTITLWMHNEYDQQGSFSSAAWVNEVRTDAALVRDALGQDASTTPSRRKAAAAAGSDASHPPGARPPLETAPRHRPPAFPHSR